MAITSLSSNAIQPTKPKNATLNIVNPGSMTYSSLLNITSGKGILSRVICSFLLSVYEPSSSLYIRITVDGGTPEVFNGASTNLGWLKGAPQGVYATGGTSQTPNTPYNLYFNSPVYFNKSMLVEIATSSTIAGQVFANCDYSLV